jgi:hypothetical protein
MTMMMTMRVLAVLALGASAVQAQSTVMFPGMECASATDWIGAGTSVANCEAACAGISPFFQRMDAGSGDSNCRCCNINGNGNLEGADLSSGGNANIYRTMPDNINAATDGVTELVQGAECATTLDWLGLADSSVASCAAACLAQGHEIFQRMSMNGGDNNCKCCDSVVPLITSGGGANQAVLLRIAAALATCGDADGDGAGSSAVSDTDCGSGFIARSGATASTCVGSACDISGSAADKAACCVALATCGDADGEGASSAPIDSADCGAGQGYNIAASGSTCAGPTCDVTGRQADATACCVIQATCGSSDGAVSSSTSCNDHANGCAATCFGTPDHQRGGTVIVCGTAVVAVAITAADCGAGYGVRPGVADSLCAGTTCDISGIIADREACCSNVATCGDADGDGAGSAPIDSADCGTGMAYDSTAASSLCAGLTCDVAGTVADRTACCSNVATCGDTNGEAAGSDAATDADCGTGFRARSGASASACLSTVCDISGSAADKAACCFEIAGLCVGNYDASTDVDCSATTQTLIASASTTSGSDAATCCQDITGMCGGNTDPSGDFSSCSATTQTLIASASTTSGSDAATCCQDITGMCSGNTDPSGNVDCSASGRALKAGSALIANDGLTVTCCDLVPCTAPSVTISTAAPLTIRPGTDATVAAVGSLPMCAVPDGAVLQWEWSCDDASITLDVASSTTSQLHLLPYTFGAGDSVTLTLTLKLSDDGSGSPTAASSQTIAVQTQATPDVFAAIAGGSSLMVYPSASLLLDGSSSYDPDDPLVCPATICLCSASIFVSNAFLMCATMVSVTRMEHLHGTRGSGRAVTSRHLLLQLLASEE